MVNLRHPFTLVLNRLAVFLDAVSKPVMRPISAGDPADRRDGYHPDYRRTSADSAGREEAYLLPWLFLADHCHCWAKHFVCALRSGEFRGTTGSSGRRRRRGRERRVPLRRASIFGARR